MDEILPRYIAYMGVYRGDYYADGDGKYLLLTTNKLKALLTWWYFMLFDEFSGGWTYVMHKGQYIKNSDPKSS